MNRLPEKHGYRDYTKLLRLNRHTRTRAREAAAAREHERLEARAARLPRTGNNNNDNTTTTTTNNAFTTMWHKLVDERKVV